MKKELIDPDMIMTEETKDRSNLYIGLVFGTVVTFCAGVLYLINLCAALS